MAVEDTRREMDAYGGDLLERGPYKRRFSDEVVLSMVGTDQVTEGPDDAQGVSEVFVAPGEDIERSFYCMSILHCLPVGMAERPSAATGAVMRPDTLRSYAREAGFCEVETLPIEHDLRRFYRLVS